MKAPFVPAQDEAPFDVWVCLPCQDGDHAECTARACRCHHEEAGS